MCGVGLDRGSPWRFDHFPETCCAVVERALPALAAALALLFFFAATAGCADDLTSDPQTPPANQRSQNQRSAAAATRPAAVARKIKLLYVDGYPRWEYRYLSQAMVRDPAIDVSCLLTSADPGYAQRADPPDPKSGFPGPIDRFPNSPEGLAKYDVVLLGDVDPREFSDGQFRMLIEFVAQTGGGFGMVAGPRFSPAAYRSTRAGRAPARGNGAGPPWRGAAGRG